MSAENKVRLVDVWVGVRDPRQVTKVEHDLVELLVVSVSAVLSGADTFAEIEAWAKEKLDWLRQYLKLEQGIPSHDTIGRVFAAINPDEFGAAFVRWVGQVLPVLANGEVVAIDGKTSRRSGRVGATPLHLVSAFAAQASLVLGQRATAEKSNEKTAIPELLATLALEGCIVTIDAMGTQPNIAQAIRNRGADYILAAKGNQPRLAESIDDFFSAFEAAPGKTPHQFHEVVEKNHGRLEVRRCYVFDQLDCLHAPERWPDLQSFAVITTERTIRGKTTSTERRSYISSLVPDSQRMNQSVRLHWRVENSLHWCMDVVFGDDQMRACSDHAAHNLAVLRQFVVNLIRLSPVKRKGGLKTQRLIAATSDSFRAELLGLV
ncbi:MAG: ISAs1 family transposase [Candidatus Accumulibacter sp.]|uniref:ISAs1 family transposase n=1 Tax=Accumulibacter sp. TaxID=2053492 RepID=UPI001B024D5D|nr:ISAs1 family transposase [Accumulibacter sp.]MBO3702479.1 ISAs1 family transposase [Accumulibacter sp.]